MGKLIPLKDITNVDILEKVLRYKKVQLDNYLNGLDTDNLIIKEKIIKDIDELEERINFLKETSKDSPNSLLETQIEPLVYPRIVEVSWDAIDFRDGALNIHIDNKIYCRKNKKYRKSFNLIKSAFVKRLPKIAIKVDQEKIMYIIDYDDFKDVIKFLKFRNTFNISKEKLIISSFTKYISNFSNSLPRFFFPEDKTPYLDYLCKIHSEDCIIVPIIEKLSYRNTIIEEDAFLFTIKKDKYYFIIWENVNVSRATYIFYSFDYNYMERLQQIFDFSTSNISNKRSNLHSNSSVYIKLGLTKIIQHTTFNEWKNKIPINK